MKLEDIFENLLFEATPEQIYDSYYKDIPYDMFVKLVSTDPTTKVSGDKIQKIGKYAKLIINMFKSNNLKIEDLPKANEYLSYVYKHQTPIDVQKINNLSDLYDVVKRFYATETKELSAILSALDESEYKKIFEGEKWIIYSPLSEKSACYLGVNTQWCTTWGSKSLNPSYKDRTNYYERYNSSGPLYVIINKNNVDEKYQFHFESKQFMNRDDNQIKTGEFLDMNEELRNFFFPSFTNDDLPEEQTNKQLDRINVLSTSDASELTKKIISKTATNNLLALSIMNEDLDKVNELIKDSQMTSIIQIDRGRIEFELDKLTGEMEEVDNTINYYNYDIQDSYSRLSDDVDGWDEEHFNGELETLFKEYHEGNAETLKRDYGILNYEQFKNEFFDNFKNDEKIKDEFVDSYVEKSRANYEAKCEEYVSDIENYIVFTGGYKGEYSVELNIGHFLIFLIKKGIKSIPNELYDNVSDVINNYIEDYNVQTEYEGVYDFESVAPTYEDLEDKINSHFDNLFENYEVTKECGKLRLILNDVIEKLFKGSDRFENEHVLVQIDNSKINCETGSIDVIYVNKDTNKQFQGPVKVENLSTYVTNYSLFESVVNFKNLI
jgi:hypothetical protein